MKNDDLAWLCYCMLFTIHEFSAYGGEQGGFNVD